ncbi:MAG: hypothetical protein P8O93_08255, partial [Flavobacteriaceae bacterium]|nr:hypothetical protein [Flavobacteriaceae bacterium]
KMDEVMAVVRATPDAQVLADLDSTVDEYQGNSAPAEKYFMMEFLLWGLETHKKLNKYRTIEGFQFKDGFDNMLADL